MTLQVIAQIYLKILKNNTQYPFGKVRNNEAFWGNKNTPNLRNKSSQNRYLLFTDADCYQIQRLDYSDELAIYDAKTIVLGYGGYENR
jgi:predicted glycosyltransferase involved in capsule biosynthesis